MSPKSAQHTHNGHHHHDQHAGGDKGASGGSHAGHAHAGHSHGLGANKGANRRRLGIAAALTGVFMVAEAVGGVVSGSLALLADAGHMFTDFGALALAWFAARLAERPADWKWTYGFDRVSILVAFVNALALFVIAALIIVEAVERFLSPSEVMGPLMLVVAVAGLLVNLLAFWVLHGADRSNLNIRGAVLHVIGDLLGSVAAIAAALIIMATGWYMADPLLSVLVAILILRSASMLVRESGAILLEGAPADIDNRDVATKLIDAVPDLLGVHHVHIWSISEERRMITLHAHIADGADPVSAIAAIKAELASQFGLEHATVEIEYGDCADTVR